ncbi:MAG: hypothetical protein A2452_06800 [Candidatus Firestonebacteria bacterium RIFOXYC2_FULL_39_67]|nr:MAG: hypothetical protein A2452_06800 [Candidatus Firestonebacteria bacterium RIFOXYC2_FULL_39_67]
MGKNTNSCKDTDDCKIEYSLLHVWLDNLPYIIMVLLGALIIGLTFDYLLAILFVLYGMAGTLWFIIFICPYCHYYGSKACPCGYGVLSKTIVLKKDETRFHSIFKKNIIAIVPLWLLPLVEGIYNMINSFSVLMLILVVIFIVDSYVILPWISRKYGCVDCPNKDECPWMGTKKK